MAHPLLERLRPRNWLDGLGLALQLVGVLGLTAVIVVAIPLGPQSASSNSLLALGPACAALSLCGYVIRRVARKQPLFGAAKKQGGKASDYHA